MRPPTFTTEQDAQIMHAAKNGIPYKDIAKKIGRTERAVANRARRIGAPLKREPTTDKMLQEIKNLYLEGHSYQQIAAKMGNMTAGQVSPRVRKLIRDGDVKSRYSPRQKKEPVLPKIRAVCYEEPARERSRFMDMSYRNCAQVLSSHGHQVMRKAYANNEIYYMDGVCVDMAQIVEKVREYD